MPCIDALYRRSGVRFYRVQVYIADGTFEERALAVRQVKVPEANELVREPLLADFLEMLEEAQARKLLTLQLDEKSGGYIIKEIIRED